MLADLPLMIQKCAPGVGQATMHAIIRTESGGHPWAIGDNTARMARQPATKEEAVATAKTLIAKGHSLDLGLGQINSKNLTGLGLTVEQVFEPCTNLAASATILTGAYQRAVKQHGQGQQALLAALSAYNTGSLVNGFHNGYVRKVVDNSGVQVSFKIPSLATGTVFKGRHGAVRVDAGGVVSPYAAPLDAWAKATPARAPVSKQAAVTPRKSPLEAPGFSTVAFQN